MITVTCRDGKADIGLLQSKLSDGWKVVSAVAVQDSYSASLGSHLMRVYTSSIVYILEK